MCEHNEHDEPTEIVASFEIPATVSIEPFLEALGQFGFDRDQGAMLLLMKRIDESVKYGIEQSGGLQVLGEEGYTDLYSATTGGMIGTLLTGAMEAHVAEQRKNALLMAKNQSLKDELEALKGEK